MEKRTGTPYRYLCGDCRDDWHLRAKCTRCHGQGWLNSEEPVTVSETSLRDKAQGLLNTLTMSQWRNLEDGISEPVLDEIEEVLRTVEREALERAANAVNTYRWTDKYTNALNYPEAHAALANAEAIIRGLNKSGDTGS